MKMRGAAFALAIALLAAASSAVAGVVDPLRFFEGRTESVGKVRLAMKKPFESRAIGIGEIRPDGSLILVQKVHDEGEQPRERRWHMRQIAPGRFTGTMSEARGPVTVEEIDGNYRFRFRMAGSVLVEQWLIPSADGKSAKSKVIVKKYGIHVGGSTGIIRKLDE